MKLLEGDVFTDVCLFTGGGVVSSHNAIDGDSIQRQGVLSSSRGSIQRPGLPSRSRGSDQ